MPARLSGLAITEVVAGFVLAWSGIRNRTLTDTARSLLQGKNPAAVPGAPPALGVSSGGSAAVTTSASGELSGASDSEIASTALQYQGHLYDFGGAPGPDGLGPWDCSSFSNFVIGVRLKMAIPGYSPGQYTGSVHGPTTLSYLAWTGCTTVGHDPSAAQAGDLAVWQTHMGICTGDGNMISAQGPNGTPSTVVSRIEGPAGEFLTIRRIR